MSSTYRMETQPWDLFPDKEEFILKQLTFTEYNCKINTVIFTQNLNIIYFLLYFFNFIISYFRMTFDEFVRVFISFNFLFILSAFNLRNKYQKKYWYFLTKKWKSSVDCITFIEIICFICAFSEDLNLFFCEVYYIKHAFKIN